MINKLFDEFVDDGIKGIIKFILKISYKFFDKGLFLFLSLILLLVLFFQWVVFSEVSLTDFLYHIYNYLVEYIVIIIFVSILFSRTFNVFIRKRRLILGYYSSLEDGITNNNLDDIWKQYIEICNFVDHDYLGDYYGKKSICTPPSILNKIKDIFLDSDNVLSLQMRLSIIFFRSCDYNNALERIYAEIYRRYYYLSKKMDKSPINTVENQCNIDKKSKYYGLIISLSEYITGYSVNLHQVGRKSPYISNKNEEEKIINLIVEHSHEDGVGIRSTIALFNVIIIINQCDSEKQKLIIQTINSIDDNNYELGWLYRRILELLVHIVHIDDKDKRDTIINQLVKDIKLFKTKDNWNSESEKINFRNMTLKKYYNEYSICYPEH